VSDESGAHRFRPNLISTAGLLLAACLSSALKVN